MNVSLTPELEQFVRGLVHAGRYGSASEVLREGLRLLEISERRRLLERALLQGLTPEEEAQAPPELLRKMRDRIEREVQVALEQAGRGELVDGETFFAEIRGRGPGRSKTKEPAHNQ